MEDSIAAIALLIPMLGIVAGAALLLMAMHHRSKLKELQYRERIAMIEKGLMPRPEVDPGRFDEVASARTERPIGVRAVRHRTAGVVLVGLGLALTFLIAVAGGEVGPGIGVGGALMVLGGAFIVNGALKTRDADRVAHRTAGGSSPVTSSTRDTARPDV